MTKKGTTKDELFLLKLYELAARRGEPQESIDCFEIGRAIGQNDKGSSVIARTLAKANFVKKTDGDAIYLTDHGLHLVQVLLESS